jgi:hypothetical protein
MLVFIVIIAISAVVAYFVVNSKKKTAEVHIEPKVQSTVHPVKEEVKVKVEPIAEVQVAEPKKKAAPKKKVVKKEK